MKTLERETGVLRAGGTYSRAEVRYLLHDAIGAAGMGAIIVSRRTSQSRL